MGQTVEIIPSQTLTLERQTEYGLSEQRTVVTGGDGDIGYVQLGSPEALAGFAMSTRFTGRQLLNAFIRMADRLTVDFVLPSLPGSRPRIHQLREAYDEDLLFEGPRALSIEPYDPPFVMEGRIGIWTPAALIVNAGWNIN